MLCDYERLSAWIDGEISCQDEIKAIEEHLRQCKSCRDMVASFRRLSAELRSDVIPPLDEQFVEDIAAAIPERPRRLSLWQGLINLWHMRIAIPAPALACLLLALCAALYWREPLLSNKSDGKPDGSLVLVEYGRTGEPVMQRAVRNAPQTCYQLRPVKDEFISFPPPPLPNYGHRRHHGRKLVIEETYVPPVQIERGNQY